MLCIEREGDREGREKKKKKNGEREERPFIMDRNE